MTVPGQRPNIGIGDQRERASSAYSHALAACHSRFTVAGEMSSASAVSGMLSPFVGAHYPIPELPTNRLRRSALAELPHHRRWKPMSDHSLLISWRWRAWVLLAMLLVVRLATAVAVFRVHSALLRERAFVLITDSSHGPTTITTSRHRNDSVRRDGKSSSIDPRRRPIQSRPMHERHEVGGLQHFTVLGALPHKLPAITRVTRSPDRQIVPRQG